MVSESRTTREGLAKSVHSGFVDFDELLNKFLTLFADKPPYLYVLKVVNIYIYIYMY